MNVYGSFASKEIAQQRYDICKSCSEFSSPLKICKQCYCLVLAKVRFHYTACPLNKWGTVEKDLSIEFYNVEKELK